MAYHLNPTDCVRTAPQGPFPGAPDMFDAIGPWPYCSPPAIGESAVLYNALQLQELVTFCAFLRPDTPLCIAQWQQTGFTRVPLKEHFVFDPTLAWPSHSAKTRYNMRRNRRLWRIEPIALADHYHTIATYHEQLVRSRQFSTLAALPPAHFAALANLPGVHVLGALDKARLGAALITLHNAASVHFHPPGDNDVRPVRPTAASRATDDLDGCCCLCPPLSATTPAPALATYSATTDQTRATQDDSTLFAN